MANRTEAELAAKDAQLAELHPLRQALSDAQDDLTQARIRIDVLEPGARNYNAQRIRADKAEDALVEMTRRMEMFAAQATHAKESTEFVKGERDTAESTLADLRRQGEWQPIETAPQNESVLIVVGGEVDIATFHTFAKGDDKGDGKVGWWASDYDYQSSEIQPTHWMPLPDAPGPLEEARR